MAQPGAAAALALQLQQPASADLNPLAPCGSCTEWLKKIAEARSQQQREAHMRCLL